MNGVSPYPRWTIDGVMKDSRECPRWHRDESVIPWIELYSHYQAGHLYRAGGVREQPALYMQVMRLIDGAVKESRSDAKSKIHT